MEVSVVNIQGEDTGRKVSLSDSIFGIEPNDHVIYLDVKQHLANKRQGTHKSKERGEVKGSTRKIKKQKGTGTARFGDIKNPIFRGGGRIFGPRPRNYGFKLNKKTKVLARRSALSYKIKDNALSVVENFSLEAPKTKDFIQILDKLSLAGSKALFVIHENDKNVYLSARNLGKAQVTTFDSLNTYDVLNADKIVLSEGSVEKIEQLLG
ncbi:MAG: 50S ribosomal protein L4 [Cyclobacteriaceae bacterium]